MVAHDFGGYRRFFGNRQIARAGAGDDNRARVFFCRGFLDCDTTGEFVVDSLSKFLLQETRVLNGNACHKNAFFALDQFRSYFQDLFGRLARSEDYFGKTFAKGAMGVDFRESKVDDRCSLEGLEDFVTAHAASAKFFKQFDCFSRRHAGKMRQKWKNPSAKSQPEANFVSANLGVFGSR
jgi:hypothetical protein